MTDDQHVERIREAARRLNVYLEMAAMDGLDVQVGAFVIDGLGQPARQRCVTIDVKRLAPNERREPREWVPFT